MTSSSDSGSSKAGGLLARLRGMVQALTAGDSPATEGTLRAWDEPAHSEGSTASSVSENPPLAMPVPESEQVASPALAVPVSGLLSAPGASGNEELPHEMTAGSAPEQPPPPASE